MLLGVVPEDADCLLEAGLDQGHGSEGHTATTAALALDRTDVAQTDRVVGGGHVGPQGLNAEERNISVVEQLNILHQTCVARYELIIKQIAELIDRFKPGSSPGQVGLVVLENHLLVHLQNLGSKLLLLGVVNWGQIEGCQELVHSLVEEKLDFVDFFNVNRGRFLGASDFTLTASGAFSLICHHRDREVFSNLSCEFVFTREPKQTLIALLTLQLYAFTYFMILFAPSVTRPLSSPFILKAHCNSTLAQVPIT